MQSNVQYFKTALNKFCNIFQTNGYDIVEQKDYIDEYENPVLTDESFEKLCGAKYDSPNSIERLKKYNEAKTRREIEEQRKLHDKYLDDIRTDFKQTLIDYVLTKRHILPPNTPFVSCYTVKYDHVTKVGLSEYTKTIIECLKSIGKQYNNEYENNTSNVVLTEIKERVGGNDFVFVMENSNIEYDDSTPYRYSVVDDLSYSTTYILIGLVT